MATKELPVPEGEIALEDVEDEMKELKNEDKIDRPEVEARLLGDTSVETDELEEGDPPDADVGDNAQGDWSLGDAVDLRLEPVRGKPLTPQQRTRARRIAVRAALLGLAHASDIHYTQGAQRWQGIADTRYSTRGQYPNFADCSAFVTWCLWNGLFVPYRRPDIVNGADWRAGFTGTMLQHGRPIRELKNVRWGDAVIYGSPGSSGRHTAIIVRVGKPRGSNVMVVSHGSEGGPFFLKYNYRPDIQSIRRYIRHGV